jgi:hypothetical protein
VAGEKNVNKTKGPDPDMNAEIGTTGKKSGGLDRQIQAKIGQQLRAMYDDVVEQGVPDRFADLLKKLDSAGAAHAASQADAGNKDDQEPRP